VGRQARLVTLGPATVVDGFRGPGHSTRLADPVDRPAATLALERLSQRDI
jgi:hypothetical protein